MVCVVLQSCSQVNEGMWCTAVMQSVKACCVCCIAVSEGVLCVLYCSHACGVYVQVMKKDSDGKFLFLSPMDIAVAGNGDIMVSDAGQFIKIFSSNFTLQKTYQSRLPKSEFWGVCTDPGGSVYVADWKYGIHVLSNTSDAKFEGLLKGVESAGIVEPTAVAFNLDSAALLVGNSSSQIYRSAFV